MPNTFKKNLLFKVLIIVMILFSIGTIAYFHYNNKYNVNKNFYNINLKNINKLMIVAHPDDDILWGGGHLIEDDYLVVCITCGEKKVRVHEFVTVMGETKDKYIMLGYPDKTNGERDNWDSSYKYIYEDLKTIIGLKEWSIIVTHNPDGEYGHIHHKMTNKIVTDIAPNKNNLYYFGHYYTKNSIINHYEELISMDGNTLKEKIRIIGLYKSQDFIQTSFDHMFPYEKWISYEEWGDVLYEETQ